MFTFKSRVVTLKLVFVKGEIGKVYRSFLFTLVWSFLAFGRRNIIVFTLFTED